MAKPAGARIVYVVDGDASVREGLSRLMDSAGLEPRPCESVREFLGQANGMHCACVLLDLAGARQCQPPLRNALHALAELLPVIALSPDDDSQGRILARELGAKYYFRKPVDGAALLDAIDWVMHDGARWAPH